MVGAIARQTCRRGLIRRNAPLHIKLHRYHLPRNFVDGRLIVSTAVIVGVSSIEPAIIS
jgi:hypothetical protein